MPLLHTKRLCNEDTVKESDHAGHCDCGRQWRKWKKKVGGREKMNIINMVKRENDGIGQ